MNWLENMRWDLFAVAFIGATVFWLGLLWLCWAIQRCQFSQCRWFHVSGNVWQCWRCKSCSVGHDPEMPQ